MCGIVGYVGSEQAAPILLGGLAKLEYRGYDSAGIAVRDESTGKIDNTTHSLPAVLVILAGQRTESHRSVMHTHIVQRTVR